MAEYAGLEIRIGGNTTKLTNALKASTKSAAELQRSLRQITKAMQFDPHDIGNVNTRIKITGDRMQSLQSKAQIAREAMRQLGDTMVRIGGEEKSIREIAGSTQDLSLKAKQADERFTRLGSSLSQIYEAWNNLSRDNGSDFLVDKLGFTHEEAERLMRSTTSLRDFNDALREEQKWRASINYTGDKPLISDEEIKRAKQFKELNFHDMFKRGVDLDDILQEAQQLGVVIEDSAVASVRDLQKAYKEAQEEKKGFDDALRYEQMGTDVKRIDSEVESLSQTMRKLDDGVTEVSQTPWFQSVEADVRKVDAAIDNLDADLERTGAALKLDPSNLELASRYFGDLQQKADLSEEKVQLLRQEMEQLASNGAGEAAKQHQDLAKWIEESAEAARKAHKEYTEQSAAVANLEDQAKGLKQAIAMVEGDELLAGYSDTVLQWKKRTDELSNAMDKLAEKEQAVADEQKKLDDAQAAFDNAKQKAGELGNQLEKLRAEYDRLSEEYARVYDDPSVSYDTKLGMYNRLNELTEEIQQVEAAYNGAQTDMRLFNQELNEQQTRANTAQGALNQQKDTVDELSESVKKLEGTREVKLFQDPTSEIDEAKAALAEMEGELDQAKAKEKELGNAYDSARTENELAKTAQKMRDVEAEAEDTKAELKSLGDELSLKGSGIFNASTVKSLGMTLSATLTPTVAAIGYKMADAASDVDSAYRDMRKTVEGTEEQFEALRSSAIEFSRTHVTSAEQILQIEAIGGELGVATEHLETFASAVSNIDVASNLDAEGAATALGHLGNILHLTEDDYVGFSDALVRLGNNGASTETEIANIAERIGAMGSIVGMSGSDVLAFASSIASTGQRAEAAGTALSRTMSFLETAVAAAGGTIDTSFESIDAAVKEGGDRLTVFANLSGSTVDDFVEQWSSGSKEMYKNLTEQLDSAKGGLQMIADVAHMSADEFAKTWESDPTAALEAFIRGLNDIEAAEGSADKVLQSLGITAVRQKQGIEGLMQTIGGLDKNLEMSEHAWKGISDEWGQAGDAANEAAKKAEGFSGQMQILKNMGQNFLAELGEGATPWIKMFAGQLEWASSAFSSLSDETKKWLVAAGGISAVIGPALSIGSTIATASGEFQKWVDKSISGMSFVKLAFKQGGQEAVDALLGSMSAMEKTKIVAKGLGSSLLKGLAAGAVVAGIAAISYALYQLYDRYKDHEAATKGLSDAIRGVGSASEYTAEGVGDAGQSLDELLSSAGAYEGRLADLARTIEDSNKQYGTYAGQMDYYAETISTLGSKAELTEDEAHKLESALLAVNDACGTTYGLDEYGNIIDTETGKIQDNTDAITDNINARKQQALISYYADDYAKATEEWAAAQDRVNDLEAEHARLTGEGGKAEWIDNYIEKVGRADLAEDAYKEAVSNTETALSNARTELSRTEEAMGILEGKIGTAQTELDKFNKAAEDAAKAQEELDRRSETVAADVSGNMKRMSEAAEKVGESDSGFNAIVENLDAIHVAASEMNDVDMSRLVTSFSDAGGSMSDVISTLEDGGVVMSTWNSALEQAPGAAERMGSLTASAFDSMYSVAGEDLNATMTLIAGLDEMQVNDKTFYIGDNGSIVDAEGEIYDINNDLASIPEEVITAYYIDDADAQKKALDAKADLDKLSKENPKPKIGVNDSVFSRAAKTAKEKLSSINGTTAKPSVKASDFASSTIATVKERLNKLDGKTATVTIYQNTVKKGSQATGGVNNRPVIPRHATGFIAKGPTLTNQGWIGEDGIEAVANWATGGAVVPLTNRRYMLPIADAIADGMSKRLGGVSSGTQVNITITGVSGPDEVADAIARKFAVLSL